MKIKRYEPTVTGEMLQSHNGPWVRVETARELAADLRFAIGLIYGGGAGPEQMDRIRDIEKKLAANTRVKV